MTGPGLCHRAPGLASLSAPGRPSRARAACTRTQTHTYIRTHTRMHRHMQSISLTHQVFYKIMLQHEFETNSGNVLLTSEVFLSKVLCVYLYVCVFTCSSYNSLNG